ncbi:tetratricopeptide repeat protein [Microcoleus vaginatus]|uniref:tetratricopeptide repeat protein n=1 Tax=Microcoleus vaginatus TaxID=119532 RepID=UPI00020D16BF|nr:Tetratricopeptide TPR_1 repeat-containing protein [Microcoleus vaginatus FGP-2]
MPGIAIVLFFGGLGFILIFICYIWGLFQAIKPPTPWEVLYFFVVFTLWVFHIKNWSYKKVSKQFLLQVTGFLVYFLLGIIIALLPAIGIFQTDGSVPNVDQGSNEQSPSSFSSDFNTYPSLSQEPSPAAEPSPTVAARVNEPNSARVVAQNSDFKQLMKLGYIYYGQGDYETALINFNRALQIRPGDAYAVKAVYNTKSAIVQSSVKE